MDTVPQVKPSDFFARHPVFRVEEFASAHSGTGQRSPQTTSTVLKRHVAAGNLINLRRGVYATLSAGVPADEAPVDPYLLTSRLAPDAVVAYHAALQFHGKSYSAWRRFDYLTRTRRRPFAFRGAEFIAVPAPTAVRTLRDLGGEILERTHAGGRVRVTTLERAMVDALDVPHRCGGWEEVWRSLEMIEFFDLDAVIAYVERLGSGTTAGRVGLFLELHREPLMVAESHLEALRRLAPSQPLYIDPKREPGTLVRGWNLVVPGWILERGWEEQA